MQTLWLGPYYLGLPDVLKGLGIIKNANQVTITLSDVKGKSQKVTMNPVSWNFSDFPKMPKLKDNEIVFTTYEYNETDEKIARTIEEQLKKLINILANEI